jgi:hypothetical protein
MSKVSRNDPCPCGSGKKFKKCCDLPKEKKMHATLISNGPLEGRISNLFAKKQVVDSSSEVKEELSSKFINSTHLNF